MGFFTEIKNKDKDRDKDKSPSSALINFLELLEHLMILFHKILSMRQLWQWSVDQNEVHPTASYPVGTKNILQHFVHTRHLVEAN